MAHRRKPLGWAFGLNSAVLVAEVAGGFGAGSLSLLLDGVHNVSDELALGFLVAAYALPTGLSGKLLRSANFFNSIGLLAICVFLIAEAFHRLAHPVPTIGLIPVIVGA